MNALHMIEKEFIMDLFMIVRSFLNGLPPLNVLSSAHLEPMKHLLVSKQGCDDIAKVLCRLGLNKYLQDAYDMA